MPTAACNADIAPGFLFHFFADIAEIESPSVRAGASVEDAIEETSGVAQPDNGRAAAIPDHAEPPGRSLGKVVTVQIFERGIERAAGGEWNTGGVRDLGR